MTTKQHIQESLQRFEEEWKDSGLWTYYTDGYAPCFDEVKNFLETELIKLTESVREENRCECGGTKLPEYDVCKDCV